MTNSQRKIKQISVTERYEFDDDNITRRSASIARVIDRMGAEGTFQLRIEKHPKKWVVDVERLLTIQKFDLTQ